VLFFIVAVSQYENLPSQFTFSAETTIIADVCFLCGQIYNEFATNSAVSQSTQAVELFNSRLYKNWTKHKELFG
jgi:hypothetical protein